MRCRSDGSSHCPHRRSAAAAADSTTPTRAPGVSRRSFLARTSAGLAAWSVGVTRWAIAAPFGAARPVEFEPYRPGRTLAPVHRVTPGDGSYAHTYYDLCPWSPSQRLLAVTRFPFQDRKPRLGDRAEACVIDLQERTIRAVYTTKVWGYQLGANLQWGPSDRYVYTNDLVDGEAVCVRIDLETGRSDAFAGPKYQLCCDGDLRSWSSEISNGPAPATRWKNLRTTCKL